MKLTVTFHNFANMPKMEKMKVKAKEKGKGKEDVKYIK